MVIELSGVAFAALVLLSGIFSPFVFLLSWLWEVLQKWL